MQDFEVAADIPSDFGIQTSRATYGNELPANAELCPSLARHVYSTHGRYYTVLMDPRI
jgi:hypothetical protein